MQTYIVRIYRAHPEENAPISGVIEDIDSGHKEIFNGLIDLQTKLADSVAKDRPELPGLVNQKSPSLNHVA